MAEKPFGIVVPKYKNVKGHLGEKVYKEISKINDNFELIYTNVVRFGDTSQKVVTSSSVRRKEVYIIHPYYSDGDSHNMEALRTADELKRSEAEKIYLFDLYNKNFRKDKRKERESLDARMIADAYEKLKINRVFTFDAHSDQLQLAFSGGCPLEIIYMSEELANFMEKIGDIDLKNCTILSPDFGAYGRAEHMANLLGTPLVVFRKERLGEDKIKVDIIGDIKKYVENRDIIIRDDVCGTGSTLEQAKDVLKKYGTGKIYACVSHLDMCKGGREEDIQKSKKKIRDSGITVISTNTVPHDFSEEEEKYFKILDISPFIADIIDCHSRGESISKYYKERRKKTNAFK